MPAPVAVLRRRLLFPADAGVGYDDVDPTKIVSDSLHRGIDLLGVGDIDDCGTRGAAVLLQLSRCRLQLLRLQIPYGHRCTRAGNCMGTGKANARGSSSDNSDLAV